MRERLNELYAAVAAHTAPECAHTCAVPHSCCHESYCSMALDNARKEGVPLPETGHPTLPLMGEHGCTAPPYLRPLCSLHTCQVNGLGFKPNDPPWNTRYWELRDEIEKIEADTWLNENGTIPEGIVPFFLFDGD